MKVRELLKNRTVRYLGGLYGVFILVLLATAMPGMVGGLPDEFPAVDFEVDDVFGGGPVRYEDYRGRPVIIYFFASW